jgi:hypothetical protein
MFTSRSSLALLAALLLAGAGSFVLFHAPEPPAAPKSAKEAADYFLGLGPDDYATYVDGPSGLSFLYPRDFRLSEGGKAQGLVLLARHPSLPMGFRIAIASRTEALPPPTKKEILAALPAPVMANVVEFLLQDGTDALRFSSEDPDLGKTRELWFARARRLYRITMYARNEELLDAWIRDFASRLRFVF